jgi:hypothetical protein
MIMNPASVESNESGRDSTAMSLLSSIERVQSSRPPSSLSPSLNVNPLKAYQSLHTGDIFGSKKTDGVHPTTFPLPLNGTKCIAAQSVCSFSTPGDFQTIRTPTASSQLLFFPCDSGSKKRTQNLVSSASNKLLKQEVEIPLIYKLARKCLWNEFEALLATSSEQDLNFVYSKDGTTVMHMVVMSRSGYINAFKSSSSKDFAVAPDGLLERLLFLNPGLAQVQCTLNGYTPLTYACLVCNQKYPMNVAASMVRVLLDHSPDSINLFTKDGLSPVDIHVVSYSHHHPDKEDTSSRGCSSATVLRALLSFSPGLACNRLQGDKITGPLELLYKCNSKTFSQAALDEMHENMADVTVESDDTLPERRQKVFDEVKKWWTWTWTVMLLKYGSESHRKWGTQFGIVHAAAMQVGCPSALIKLALFAFPGQAKQLIMDKEDNANLPLHAVCSWQGGTALKCASKSLIETRKSQAIAALLEEYPAAAMMANNRGELPLELAAKSSTTWEGGIRRLVKAYPRALCIPSKQTGLCPFMTAATGANNSATAERQMQTLKTVYALLRTNPKAVKITLTPSREA